MKTNTILSIILLLTTSSCLMSMEPTTTVVKSAVGLSKPLAILQGGCTELPVLAIAKTAAITAGVTIVSSPTLLVMTPVVAYGIYKWATSKPTTKKN